MTSNTSEHPVTSFKTSNSGALPTMTSYNVITSSNPTPEPDSEGLSAILQLFGQPEPNVVEKLRKSYKDKNGRWHEMELDYIGHATLTKWLIETDPLWNWEPVAWEDGRPKIHVNGDTAELWIRLTVLGKTVIGVGTAAASKSDLPKELIGDALRNAGMRLGYALALWSKSEWDTDTPETPASSSSVQDITIDPVGWVIGEMKNATSVDSLDAVARLAKAKLTDTQRAEVRPFYLTRKAELTGADDE